METLLAPARAIFSPQNLWLWIATSVLISALANGFAWRDSRLEDKKVRHPARWLWLGLREAARLLYFVGLPYVALLAGLIPSTQIGLPQQDLMRDLMLALPLGLGAVLVLLLLRALALRSERTAPHGTAPEYLLLPSWAAVRESVYQEIHWAFYRSAPLLTIDDRTQAIAFGLGIAALEAWLSPDWRARWRDPALASSALRTAGLAVTMTVVFWVTGNLWVTMGVHVAVEMVSRRAWSRDGSAFGLRE